MPRKRPKRGSVALGFVVTVGILSLVTVALLEVGGGVSVTVVQMPSTLPAYSGFLGQFVPGDALQASFDNLTAIRAVNESVISTQQFFELDQPRVSVNTSSIGWRLTVGLTTPNATVNVATLDPASFDALSSSLTAAGNSNAVPTQKAGNLTLYAAAGKLSGEVQAYWLTVIPGERALVYSPGANDALQAVEKVVNVYFGKAASILDQTQVDRMLYAVNGTRGHLALGIQNFPGSVRSGQATVIAVDASPTSALIDYVVRFADADSAQSQVSAVKATYISAHQFFIYDELVKAVEVQPVSQLKVAVGLVG
jgi:hypothetical protein